ncbi:DUF4112 domain-containing protein [Falsirhodobacter algicola]|uniref:DUF4112 domain-containing protein n=1 Tax=Falsirhodobacter algicola TaxID=2692330 RepID=A0A8J8MVQ5_9RHOB|nr:DUF4112 domain-containing protein [Falsirhodobacter algicola]QUS37281.1 DUF4112 domain-containing protein [Falsirhodobacter algicola]
MERQRELERLDRLAKGLDAQFRILGIRFGWDAILGLLPGVGDVATTIPSALIIHRAWRLGVPRHVLLHMCANTGVDMLVGSIPLLGSVFDVAFRANLRNIALIRRHLNDLP